MARTSTGYKTKYDYPNAIGVAVCTKCGKECTLLANYCIYCRKELEDFVKQGFSKA